MLSLNPETAKAAANVLFCMTTANRDDGLAKIHSAFVAHGRDGGLAGHDACLVADAFVQLIEDELARLADGTRH